MTCLDNKSLAYEATISMFRSDKQGEVVFHETDEFYVLELLKKNCEFNSVKSTITLSN